MLVLRLVSGMSFIAVVVFAALHLKPRIGAVVVAGHVIVLKPEQIEREPETNILRTADTEPRGAKFLCLDKIGGFFDSRWHVGTDVRNGNAMDSGDKAEFTDIDS